MRRVPGRRRAPLSAQCASARHNSEGTANHHQLEKGWTQNAGHNSDCEVMPPHQWIRHRGTTTADAPPRTMPPPAWRAEVLEPSSPPSPWIRTTWHTRTPRKHLATQSSLPSPHDDIRHTPQPLTSRHIHQLTHNLCHAPPHHRTPHHANTLSPPHVGRSFSHRLTKPSSQTHESTYTITHPLTHTQSCTHTHKHTRPPAHHPSFSPSPTHSPTLPPNKRKTDRPPAMQTECQRAR